MITLRPYRTSDVDRLVELANDPQVSRYLVYTFPYPYTRADAEWWVETGCNLADARTRVIELDGVFVGSVGITPWTGWKAHQGEIGYWLGRAYWGRGIATEALRQMTDQGFGEMALRKLCGPVLAPNIASMRVLEKVGYRLEGILKQDVERGGELHDIHHYAKLADGAG